MESEDSNLTSTPAAQQMLEIPASKESHQDTPVVNTNLHEAQQSNGLVSVSEIRKMASNEATEYQDNKLDSNLNLPHENMNLITDFNESLADPSLGFSDKKQLSSIASFGKINMSSQALCQQLSTELFNELGDAKQEEYTNVLIPKPKSNSQTYQQRSNSNQMQKQCLQSPNHNNPQQQFLLLSANSKNSAQHSGRVAIPQNFTMRSLKSQHSNATHESITNRAPEQASYLQKSPHISDPQDPYAYFNMHQQKQSQMMQPVKPGKEEFVRVQDKQLTSEPSDRVQDNSSYILKPQANQVKSCRTNIYGMKQAVSQRGHILAIPGVPIVSQKQNFNNSSSSNNDQKTDQKSAKTMSETMKQAQMFLTQGEEPFVLNQNQVTFVNQSNHPQQNLKNEANVRKQPFSAKTKFGIQKSGGSGSRGSNFNSSSSTIPAGPVQRLSEVKNPQKLMSFRFVNQKATKLTEISSFKNLQELDLSGNLLQDQVKELQRLNFLKRLSLSNNKISEMWELPQSLEIVNLSCNFIKKLSKETCKKMKNVTTLDIQNNKLETLENVDYLQRLKRLLAKNNYVRDLSPLQSIVNIFEIDLEANAVDSHIDFINLIKGKHDLIVFNLHRNPLLVDIETIEQFNSQLISQAPQHVTQKTEQEINDLLELFGASTDAKTSKHQQQAQLSDRKGFDTQRQMLYLVVELHETLSYLKNGILYRNKRVFNKLKAIQLKTQRFASDVSNYSQRDVNNKKGGTVSENQQPKATGVNQQQKSKDVGSTEDKHNVNLTPESDNKVQKLCLNSSQQRPVNQKTPQSQLFSPVTDIKTRRYEDIEAIYDYIVEQEELRRLKREKLLAKKKANLKKLMISHIEGEEVDSDSVDNLSHMSQYSDEDDDESNDFSEEDIQEFMEPRDYYESCLNDHSSSRIEFQNQRLHDDEMASHSFTSDLEAELNSYKKGNEVSAEKIEDQEFLNGSTAGFGKKLREINKEINQEHLNQVDPETQSIEFSLQPEDYMQSSKAKTKFDLNLHHLKDGKRLMQSDLKKTIPDEQKMIKEQKINISEFKMQKQIKTTKNSDGSEDENSIKPPKHEYHFNHNEISEVESLMMNKQIQGANASQQNQYIIDMTKTPLVLQNNQVQKKSMHKDTDSNQNIHSKTESLSFKQPVATQNNNTSVNLSLMNNSMAQSIQSLTYTSKKTIIANLKLDLSKCKQDDDEFINDFEDSKSLQTIKSQNFLSSIVKQDSDLDNQSQVNMEDIVFAYNKADTIDSMNIQVERDSYRNNSLRQPIKNTNNSKRDPTPLPAPKNPQPRKSNDDKVATPTNQCLCCKKIESKIHSIQKEHESELNLLRDQLQRYQEVLIKIKQKLNLNGEFEFCQYIQPPDKDGSSKPKPVLKLNRFADIVLLIFKRIYSDLETQKSYNNKLESKFKIQQKELQDARHNYALIQREYQTQMVYKNKIHTPCVLDDASISKNTDKMNKVNSQQVPTKILSLSFKDNSQYQQHDHSESSNSEMEETYQAKKKSASTMRNIIKSSQQQIKAVKQRVNSNPKLPPDQQRTYTLSQQRIQMQKSHQPEDQQEALEDTQQTDKVSKLLALQQERFFHSMSQNSNNGQKEEEHANKGVFLSHIGQNSQLHILPNSNLVKMITQPDITSQGQQSSFMLSSIDHPLIMIGSQDKKLKLQSQTSRSGKQQLTFKKIKSPAVQNYSKKLEQVPQYLNISHSNKKQGNDDAFDERESQFLSLNSGQVQNYQNYHTSRMCSTANMVNTSQMRSEKRAKFNSNHSNSIKQSFKTQRKITQGRNVINPNSQVLSLLPSDNMTQRIQTELLNKSGAANMSNIINLQQTFDQGIRKKSIITAMLGLSGRATTENMNLKVKKRPQSVAAERTRKSNNKAQYQAILQKHTMSKSTMQNRSKSKYKSKSTERKVRQNQNLIYKEKNSSKISNAKIETHIYKVLQ